MVPVPLPSLEETTPGTSWKGSRWALWWVLKEDSISRCHNDWLRLQALGPSVLPSLAHTRVDHFSDVGDLPFQDSSVINLFIPFLSQKPKLQTLVVPTPREAPLFCEVDFPYPDTLRIFLHSFLLCSCIHTDRTPRHKSVVRGSDEEGFTDVFQDHWDPGRDRWLDTETARGKQRGTETRETGTDKG